MAEKQLDFDPYEALGVPTDATPEEIRRAHREGALRCHPDRGGDKVKFQQLQVSYRILSDPDKRKQYDESGKDCDAPANEHVIVYQTLATLFETALSACVKSGKSPIYQDLMKDIACSLKNREASSKTRLASLNRASKELKEVASRISINNGAPDIFRNVLEKELQQVLVAVESLEKELKMIENCSLALQNYSYRFEQRPASPTISTTTATSNTILWTS